LANRAAVVRVGNRTHLQDSDAPPTLVDLGFVEDPVVDHSVLATVVMRVQPHRRVVFDYAVGEQLDV
jgi:hypothetical protein